MEKEGAARDKRLEEAPSVENLKSIEQERGMGGGGEMESEKNCWPWCSCEWRGKV